MPQRAVREDAGWCRPCRGTGTAAHRRRLESRLAWAQDLQGARECALTLAPHFASPQTGDRRET
jgi:hypothetical protein